MGRYIVCESNPTRSDGASRVSRGKATKQPKAKGPYIFDDSEYFDCVLPNSFLVVGVCEYSRRSILCPATVSCV